MTFRLLFLLLCICLLPTTGAAAQLRTLEVELSFDIASVTGKTVAGYKLYQDSLLVCETNDPAATTILCEFLTEDGPHTYELAARFTDNTESPKSAPFTFTISSTGGPVGTTPPPEPTPVPSGSYRVNYAWQSVPAGSGIVGYRMYMNETVVCETSEPLATTLSCATDLINGVMSFAVVSFDANGVESEKSNFLTLDPAEFPELFQRKTTTFTWEYADAPQAPAASRFLLTASCSARQTIPRPVRLNAVSRHCSPNTPSAWLR